MCSVLRTLGDSGVLQQSQCSDPSRA
jgi:hypothetical protein